MHGDEKIRVENNLKLKKILAKRKINYISINGDYQKRFQKTVTEVEKILK